MPIYRLIGTKWSVSKNLVQSIDEKQPLIKMLPLISRKLAVPSMKDYNLYSCNDKLQPVKQLDIEESLSDQGVNAGATGGHSAIYIAPRDTTVELAIEEETVTTTVTQDKNQNQNQNNNNINNNNNNNDDDSNQKDHQEDDEKKAAIKIQSVARQHQAKQELDQLKKEKQQREEEEEKKRREEQNQEEEAAVKIQSLMRKKIASEKLEQLKKEQQQQQEQENNTTRPPPIIASTDDNNNREPSSSIATSVTSTATSNNILNSYGGEANKNNSNNRTALSSSVDQRNRSNSLSNTYNTNNNNSFSNYGNNSFSYQPLASGGVSHSHGSMYFGQNSKSKQRSSSRMSNPGSNPNTNNTNNNNPTTPNRAASLYVKSATLERELTGEKARSATAMAASTQNRLTATMQTFLMAEVENRFRKIIIPERDARVELALHMVHSAQWAVASGSSSLVIQQQQKQNIKNNSKVLEIKDSNNSNNKEDPDDQQANQEELDAFEKMRSAQERQRELTNKLESENIKLRREFQEARLTMQNQQREYEYHISNLEQQNNENQTQLLLQQSQQQQALLPPTTSTGTGGFSSPMSPSQVSTAPPPSVPPPPAQHNHNNSNNNNNNTEDMQDIRNQLESLREVASREEGQLSALKQRLMELTKLYHNALEARDFAIQEKEEMRSNLQEMETSCALEIQRVRRAAAGEVMTLQRALTAVDRDRTVNALHVGESIAQITQRTKKREQQQQQQQNVTSSSSLIMMRNTSSNNTNSIANNKPQYPSLASSSNPIARRQLPSGINQSPSINNINNNNLMMRRAMTPPMSSSSQNSEIMSNDDRVMMPNRPIQSATYEEGRSELKNLYDKFVTSPVTPKGWN